MKSTRSLLLIAAAVVGITGSIATAQASIVNIQAIKVCNDDGSNCASANSFQRSSDARGF